VSDTRTLDDLYNRIAVLEKAQARLLRTQDRSDDADTLDTKHASAFAGFTIRPLVSDTTDRNTSSSSYVDMAGPQQTVDVINGDIVIAELNGSYWDAAGYSAEAVYFAMWNGAAYGGTDKAFRSPAATYRMSFALTGYWAATGTATWTINARWKVGSATTIHAQFMHLLVLRYRPGGN
jgi:hypothetical protein